MKIFSNKGLTLVEVLVALAVLAVAFVAVLKSNMLAQDTQLDAQKETVSTLLALDLMTSIQGEGVEDWHQYRGDFGRNYPDYAWEAEIEQSIDPELYTITVSILDKDNQRVINKLEAILRPEGYSVPLEE